MKLLGGKEIFETLDELVLPKHTALLIHDMQNDFCAPSGKLFDKVGEAKESVRESIRQTRELLDSARRAGVMVAFSRASHFPGGTDESPVHLHHLLRRGQRGGEPNVVIGTWGHEIVSELAPQAGELVFDKFSFSCFQGTVLEKMLKLRSIRTIVLTGVASHSGVLTAARVATTLDYYLVVPRQCIAGTDAKQHEAAMELLGPDVYAKDDIVKLWG
ncbi:MAG: isochorismatase family protein [Deltaproteobacteria bacterium]|nr:isochorismatase family protein [Deltaproteobacteria bacterium]